jgi:hypothetical protein
VPTASPSSRSDPRLSSVLPPAAGTGRQRSGHTADRRFRTDPPPSRRERD